MSAAADEIRKFRPVLESNLAGASGLFQQKLADRLAWVDPDDLSTQQAKLARQYLDRRDYVRASLFGWEALLTMVCEKGNLDSKILIFAKTNMFNLKFSNGLKERPKTRGQP